MLSQSQINRSRLFQKEDEPSSHGASGANPSNTPKPLDPKPYRDTALTSAQFSQLKIINETEAPKASSGITGFLKTYIKSFPLHAGIGCTVITLPGFMESISDLMKASPNTGTFIDLAATAIMLTATTITARNCYNPEVTNASRSTQEDDQKVSWLKYNLKSPGLVNDIQALGYGFIILSSFLKGEIGVGLSFLLMACGAHGLAIIANKNYIRKDSDKNIFEKTLGRITDRFSPGFKSTFTDPGFGFASGNFGLNLFTVGFAGFFATHLTSGLVAAAMFFTSVAMIKGGAPLLKSLPLIKDLSLIKKIPEEKSGTATLSAGLNCAFFSALAFISGQYALGTAMAFWAKCDIICGVREGAPAFNKFFPFLMRFEDPSE